MTRRCTNERCDEPQWHAELCKSHWFDRARIDRNDTRKKDLKDILLAEQCKRCANPGCQEPLDSDSHLDHDHDCCGSGMACAACTRGVLCPSCNALLGFAHDDVKRLRGAANYLESFQRYAMPMAIVNRNRRGWSLYQKPPDWKPYQKQVSIPGELRPEGGLSDEWEYRPEIVDAIETECNVIYERALYVRQRAIAKGLIAAEAD